MSASSETPSVADETAADAAPALTGQQLAVYQALVEVAADQTIANIYLGAIQVLGSENPDRYALAAHGFRELLDRLPMEEAIEKEPDTTLGGLVGNLRTDWKRAVERSCATSDDGVTWNGQVDDALTRLLKRLGAFLEEAKTLRPPRSDRARRFIRDTDPMATRLPEPIENLRVELWQRLKDYFAGVAHHTGRLDDFSGYVRETERFLLDHLNPRTFEDRSEILEIIREGEADD